ncbi:APC family permease [Acinetobacter sp. MB5]|uniref:APC family permease n=1 Tax=Acinetobacter sp. MB5 TaxID=2069438 RepID=UPI000DD0894D|nr:APC family permease [Acinetobacter sp. MB5]
MDNLNKQESLSGSLGILSIVFMVIATAAPLTVMVAVTPLIITLGNGGGVVFDIMVATIIMLLFSVGFVAMSKYIDNAGAFYAFIQKGLGRSLGLGSASLAWVSYLFILIALEAYIGVAFSDLLKNFLGIEIPWWILSLLVISIVGYLGYRHIELSSKFLGVALVAEIAVVLIVDLLFFQKNGVTGLASSAFSMNVVSSGSIGLGIMFAIFGFIGFESTVIFREEAKDPQKTIPRATYLAVILVGLFYCLSTWCLVSIVGPDKIMAFTTQHGENTYLLVAEQYLGKFFSDIILVLLVTSLFACILSLHNVVVRYQYVLGKFGVLPSGLSKVHVKHNSPYMSSATQSVSSFVILGTLIFFQWDPVANIYTWGAMAGTLGYMFILSLTCISVVVFFLKNKEGSLWKTFIAPMLGLLGLLFCLGMAIINLPALVGDSTIVAKVVGLVLVCTFCLGVLIANIMKIKSPQKFDRLKELA